MSRTIKDGKEEKKKKGSTDPDFFRNKERGGHKNLIKEWETEEEEEEKNALDLTE